MSVVVIGLNHRTVPLELLERMTVPDDRVPKALHDLCSRPFVSEAVVLSTCNRTEVYAVADKFHGAYASIRDFLSDLAHIAPEDFADHLYTHYDSAAAAHLFTVTAGLDSAVLGESEIQGQVRRAWDLARSEGAARGVLNHLFRHALEVGKRARTETGIARNIASVSSAAVAMASQRLDGLAGRQVLVLGAGDMGEGMALSLADAGVDDLLVANRTWERSVELARRVGGQAVRLSDLPTALGEVDVLLTSTGATSVMVEHADLEEIMRLRGDRPLLIVDVAVPRDVDPAAADVDGVTLLDMDDLRAFAADGVRERRREVAAVRSIVDDEVERYLDATSARQVAPLVADLRERAESVREAEMARYRSRLDALDERQMAAVEALTRGLLAKLLHEPTVRLKDAAGTARGERLAEAVTDLFDL